VRGFSATIAVLLAIALFVAVHIAIWCEKLIERNGRSELMGHKRDKWDTGEQK
jgi:Sec-independent protein secretion pathway component TatC